MAVLCESALALVVEVCLVVLVWFLRWLCLVVHVGWLCPFGSLLGLAMVRR